MSVKGIEVVAFAQGVFLPMTMARTDLAASLRGLLVHFEPLPCRLLQSEGAHREDENHDQSHSIRQMSKCTSDGPKFCSLGVLRL